MYFPAVYRLRTDLLELMSESGTGGHSYKIYKHHCIGLYVFYQIFIFLSELFTLGTLPASKVGFFLLSSLNVR